MQPIEIIDQLSSQSILLSATNDKLVVEAEPGLITAPIASLIRDNKQALLEYFRSKSSASPNISRAKKIVKQKTNKLACPLSFSQQSLWFIDKIKGSSAQYNIPIALDIKGQFDLEAANQVFQNIVQRHEVLRTVYLEQNDVPVQCVVEKFNFCISYIDLSAEPIDARSDRLESLLQDEAQRPFDLSQDLMLRVSYFDVSDSKSEQKGKLLINMHHIASDGWSLEVLTREFMTHYKAITAGEKVQLPQLDIQYVDYALWQRQWLQGEVLDKQLRYWEKQLADTPPVHSLPLDKTRPEVKQHQGDIITKTLPADISKKLIKLAKQHQVTPFMLLHAALALVLSRHSNSHDIVIGTPVANRLQDELAPLIGFFVNTLVLRVNTKQDSLNDYLAHVRQTHLDAQSHQDVPFEQLVERLNVPRSTAHTPLFQIMITTNSDYALNNEQANAFSLPEVTFTPASSNSVVAKFDLKVNMNLSDEGGRIECTFDTALFEHKRINKISIHLARLLECMASTESKPSTEISLDNLNFLSKQEIKYLVNDVNNTSINYPKDVYLHEDIAFHASTKPHATALICEGKKLTYAELDTQSNQLANYLIQTYQVQQGDLIGLHVERSLDIVIGILAILKAGAAYVPLDPDSPEARLNYIIKDTALRVVLTQARLSNKNIFSNISSVNIDSSSYRHTSSVAPSIQSSLTPEERTAYVIYTSGTTGNPKGVCQTHQTMMSFIYEFDEQLQVLDVDEKSPWLWVSSYAFDASIKGLVCLATGKPVVIASQSEYNQPKKLADLIHQYQIPVFNSVPQLLSLVVEEIGTHPIHLISGGDSIPNALLSKLIDYTNAANTKLLNAYGPTETGINSTFAVISDKQVIGKPTINTTVLVLDSDRKLLPKGAIGELYIGGDGLAQGYLNAPELTKERFIENPFSAKSSCKRLYKSGDLVRYMDDGNLEFIGRVDNQVKIRGFRIELGEVETALSSHAKVDSAVALCKKDELGSQQLVAFIKPLSHVLVCNEDIETSLRQSLRQSLPNYMQPDNITFVESWPFNTSGKIDNHKLLNGIKKQVAQAYQTPSTETEKQLVETWARVLNMEENTISIDANFFELGGNSLLAISLVKQIQQHLRVNLPTSTLFEHQTILSLANFIESYENTHNTIPSQQLVNLREGDSRLPALFFVHPLGGQTFCYREILQHLNISNPIYALQSVGTTHSTLSELSTHYLSLARKTVAQGPIHFIGWSMGGVIAQEMQRQASREEDNSIDITLIDSYPTPNDNNFADKHSLIMMMAKEMNIDSSGLQLENYKHLTTDQALELLRTTGVKQHRLPIDITAEDLAKQLAILTHNDQLFHQHQMQFNQGKALLIAAGNNECSSEWHSYIQQLTVTQISDSDHFSIVGARFSREIASQIQNMLYTSTNFKFAK